MKKILLKTFIFTLILSLLWGFVPPLAVYTQTIGAMRLYEENANLALYFDPASGAFAVENKKTGRLWHSNPDDWEDNNLSGMPKFSMNSQIMIETMQEGMALSPAVSRTGSVMQGGMTSERIAKGIKIMYHFPLEFISVPLSLILHDDRLEVCFDLDQVQYDENIKKYLMSVSLAPYFGCGRRTDEGYMVVPDGSGGIINFNNNKQTTVHYNERVYGIDPAMYGDLRPAVKNPVNLPIFGIENKGESVLAVIKEGAASATIRAYTAGQYSTQNNIYAHFNLYAADTVIIGRSTGAAMQSAIKYELERPMTKLCVVDYYFPYESGYNAMAKLYGEILRMGAVPSDFHKAPFYVSLFGAMKKKESFLGFQMNRTKKMTTFKEATEILLNLQRGGVNDLVLMYTHWSSEEINGRMQSNARPSGSLGGMRGLKNLLNAASEADTQVFLGYNPLAASKMSFSYIPLFNAARGMDGKYLQLFRYRLSTLYQDSRYNPFIFPDVNFLVNNSLNFFDRVKRLFGKETQMPGLYFPSVSNTLYGNYDTNDFMTRWEAKERMTNSVFDGQSNYIVNAANDYAILGAAHILEAPMSSSGQDIIDYDIPFYALAVSGIAAYSLPAVNNAANPRTSLLKSIETGAGLYFNWVYNDPSIFIDSPYERYYSTNYSRWVDEALDMYREHGRAFDAIGSCVLVRHERVSEMVTLSTFANGKRVLVNYGAENFIYGSASVKAENWLVLR